MKQQLSIGNLYLAEMRSFSDFRKEQLKDDMSELRTNIAIAFFLLMNIFLGVLGTFWFRTQQRREEMGLRIAIGSTKSKLRTLLIGEGLMLLFLSMPLVVAVCFNLAHAELVELWRMDFTFPRFLVGLLITYLLMALMIIAGIWYPSREIIKLQPAEALRDE